MGFNLAFKGLIAFKWCCLVILWRTWKYLMSPNDENTFLTGFCKTGWYIFILTLLIISDISAIPRAAVCISQFSDCTEARFPWIAYSLLGWPVTQSDPKCRTWTYVQNTLQTAQNARHTTSLPDRYIWFTHIYKLIIYLVYNHVQDSRMCQHIKNTLHNVLYKVHFTNIITHKNNLNIKIMEHFTISIILNTVYKFVDVL